MIDLQGRRYGSLKNYTFTLLSLSFTLKAAQALFYSTIPDRDKKNWTLHEMLPFAKMPPEKLCAWMTLCGSDIIALIASVKDLPYWLSCPIVSVPACPSTYLFAYFLLACLSVWLPTHLHTRVILFMQVRRDIIFLLVFLIAVMLLFPYLTFWKKSVAIALCTSIFLQLLSLKY